MRCSHPVIRNVHFTDGTVGKIMTPCTVCNNCRKNFAHMWGCRVYHESLSYDKCAFVTLTYSPEKLPIGSHGYPTIDIDDVQKFFKSWREYIYPEKIRYFVGCEYTPQNHLPHYHCAVFGASIWDDRIFKNHVARDGGYSVDCKFWDKGFVHVGNLEPGSANYVAGYALKKVSGSRNRDFYKNLGITPPRALMSRRPGIGLEFVEKYKDVMLRLGSTTVDGTVVSLPRYYIDKIGYRDTSDYIEMRDDLIVKADARHIKMLSYDKDIMELDQQFRWIDECKNRIVDANERKLK